MSTTVGAGNPAEAALAAATAGLSREDLLGWLGDAAKLWLAHDGLWFRAVEGTHGLEEAIRLDEQAMGRWSAGEARRIMERVGLPPGGGLETLEQALRARLYALLNEQDIRIEEVRGAEGETAVEGQPDAPRAREQSRDRRRLVFTMRTCRVQDARDRQGLPPFPCRVVGLAEYREFARVIDPRLEVTCRHCPPGERPQGAWCAWEFTLGSSPGGPPGASLRG